MSDLESTIIPMDPSLLVEELTSPSMFSSVSRARRLARAISIFKREFQSTRMEAKPAVTDPLARVNNDNEPDGTLPSSPTENFDFTPLIDIQPYLTTPPAREQKAERDAICNDIRHSLWSFKLRLHSCPMCPLNVSPHPRAPFEAMVWTLLIIDHLTPAIRDASVPSHSIPLIKSLSVNNISVLSGPKTRITIDKLNVYFRRTELLVQLYTMPSDVTIKLAEIAIKINGSKFARYMGSRGPWSLRRAFGGLQVLLHWWAATSPVLMRDFATAIFPHSKTANAALRTTLRAELKGLFDIHHNHQEGEKMLGMAISRGYDEISMFRGELHTVIEDAFEDLVERGRAAEVNNNSKMLSVPE
jgi:hypothetical protein